MKAFSLSKTPQLHFGEGKLSVLPSAVKTFGSRIVLVTGARSFLSSSQGQKLIEELNDQKIQWEQYSIAKEPDPLTIDTAVNRYSPFEPDSVVAIGGGSVLDAGKAISAMLPLRAAVKDYLEGVGKLQHPGSKVPFIAVPTTSGTGSEATKNAVVSETGEYGYKRSLRHSNFVPDLAIIDPSLTLNCPPEATAASGMDAFTQLLESFLSTTANPVTDSLALEGLHCISRSLLKSYRDGQDIEARTDMALAAYLSGITLANAGLGLVHGFASPIGGFFEIPHGIICATLMAPANKVTVRKLRTGKGDTTALSKYATVGRIFGPLKNKSDDYYIDFLIELMTTWSAEMKIPSLHSYGLTQKDFEKIVDNTDCKNNPVVLDKEELWEVFV